MAYRTFGHERLEAPARLAVLVEGVPSPDAERVIHELWDKHWPPLDFVAERAASAVLHLQRDGRDALPLPVSRVRHEGTSSEAVLPSPYVALGTEAISDALTPGHYTLVARTPEGREVRCAVELLPGRTTAVTLVFE